MSNPDASYDGGNTTGFVSPAQDSLDNPIDLTAVLDLTRPHRYPVRVAGDALRHRGIRHGDVLIACTATLPKAGRVCVAMTGGDVVVAVLAQRGTVWLLRPSDDRQRELPLGKGDELWAVVTGLVRTEV